MLGVVDSHFRVYSHKGRVGRALRKMRYTPPLENKVAVSDQTFVLFSKKVQKYPYILKNNILFFI